jgi:hypothetical protein
LLKPFQTLGKFDDKKAKAFWDSLDNLAPLLGQFGEAVGGFITSVFTPANISLAEEGITLLGTAAKSFMDIIGLLIKIAVPLVGLAMTVISPLVMLAKGL